MHLWEYKSTTLDDQPIDTTQRNPVSGQLKKPDDANGASRWNGWTTVSELSGLSAECSGTLTSSSNYFFADNCSNITNLKITVTFTENLVAAYPTGTNQNMQQGFSFQLNCNSPIDAAKKKVQT